MSTEHTTAQVDAALAFSDCGDSTGGFRTHESLRILAAEVRRLRDERENWRVSSIAREAVARAEQAEAKIAALVSAGDRLRSSVGNFTIYREVVSACAQWDAARSQEAQR